MQHIAVTKCLQPTQTKVICVVHILQGLASPQLGEGFIEDSGGDDAAEQDLALLYQPLWELTRSHESYLIFSLPNEKPSKAIYRPCFLKVHPPQSSPKGGPIFSHMNLWGDTLKPCVKHSTPSNDDDDNDSHHFTEHILLYPNTILGTLCILSLIHKKESRCLHYRTQNSGLPSQLYPLHCLLKFPSL